MAWIKVDDQMTDHPKIEPLSDAAFRWVHRGLSYANRFLTNGVLPAVFLSKVPPGCLVELTTVVTGQKNPVWHLSDAGQAIIHDFKDYQPSKSEVERERKKNRARQAKWRAAHNGGRNGARNGVINGAPSRPGPAPSSKNPQPPKGGSRRRRRRPGELPESHPAAVAQALETRLRRQAMAESGMSPEDIEAVFEREYEERRRAS